MKKKGIGAIASMFTGQKKRIVNHILKNKFILNWEMPHMGILSYTKRISEIRQKLLLIGYDIPAQRMEGGVFNYTIRRAR